MRVCPSCGHQNSDDVDFCANCGQYVRWEPTRLASAVPAAPEANVATPEAPAPAAPAAPPAGDGNAAPPAAVAPPAAPPPTDGAAPPPQAPPGGGTLVIAAALPEPPAPDVPPDSIVLALRVPGLELPPDAQLETNVDPGGQAVIMALVRNQSGIVDNYDVSVGGLPEGWSSTAPATLYLVPYGASAENSEAETTVSLHPPRAPDAEARPWPIEVIVNSRAHGVIVGRAPALLHIGPYYDLDSEIRPERKGGVRRARFAIAARNKSNTPFDVSFTALDPDNAIQFEFEHPTVPTKPGRRNGTVFWTKPYKQLIIGRKVDRRFTVETKSLGGEAVAMPRMGVYTQRPWLPWWLLILLPLLLLLLLLLYLKWPRNEVVPNVRICGNLACAQSLLENRGFKLGKTTEVTTDLRPPGSPVRSSPGTGRKVEKGTVVDLFLAVGTGKKKVPSVVGLTFEEADGELKKAGFQPGEKQPEPGPTDKVKSQVPKGNTLAPEGSAIDLFFAVTPTTSTGTTGSTSTGTTTTNGTGGKETKPPPPPPPPPPVLPAGTGPHGGILPTSLGIVFDDGRDILVMGGATGKPLKVLVKSDEIEQTPAVNPDGSLIAYARGPATDLTSQIFLVDPKKPQFAHALTSKGSEDRRPAFSPDGKVIAFIRTKLDATKKVEQDSDLCFVPITAAASSPRCIVDPKTKVSRPAWSPDGHAILVTSTDATAQQRELAEYTSNTANSSNPASWNPIGAVTDKMHSATKVGEQVLYAAWSPKGDEVAMAVNWGAGLAFHLVTVAAKDDVLDTSKAKAFVRIVACELAWGPGDQIAVVQRGPSCADPRASIVRLDPTKPDKVFPLTKAALGGQNPAWTTKPPSG